jgi:membrane protease YdiL (CAAX protease family)
MPNPEDEQELDDNLPQEQQFFIMGGSLFSIGFIFIAFGLGWLLNVNPLSNLNWSWSALIIGTLAALPMFLVFLLSVKLPFQAFQQINQFLLDEVGPRIANGTIWELLILSIFIGLGEELVFRGVLQSWSTQYGVVFAIILTNMIFGILHSITRLYVVVATLMGVYLSLLLVLFSPQNLLIPITTHTVYDFLCFLMVIHIYRKQQPAENPTA